MIASSTVLAQHQRHLLGLLGDGLEVLAERRTGSSTPTQLAPDAVDRPVSRPSSSVEVAGKQRDLPENDGVRGRLRTCMSSIILWRSGVMMDSSSCRDTWSTAPGARYAGATTVSRLVESRHHVWVVFGKRFDETAEATPTAKRFSSISTNVDKMHAALRAQCDYVCCANNFVLSALVGSSSARGGDVSAAA